MPVPFRAPSRHHQQQHQGVVRGVVGEDVGRVGHHDTARLGRACVDVIEPDTVVGEDACP